MLMRLAGVPAGPVAVQASAALCGVLAVLVAGRWSALPAVRWPWPPLALTAGLWLPFVVAGGDGPFRWVSVAGVRLYLAPLLVPALFRLVSEDRQPRVRAAALVAAALALLAQPDAAQATATAGASLVLLWRRRPVGVDIATLAVLVTSALAAWQRPDPLTPVAHVEGVFLLAAGAGPAALTAAWGAAVLPVAILLWIGVTARDRGLLAVAAYYGALLAHAPLLVTPVPLIGYGAAPILGYAAMAMLSTDATHEHTSRPSA